MSPYTQGISSKYRNTNSNTNTNQYSRKVAQEPLYGELEDKYQELYQAYKEKSAKLVQF